MDKRKILEQYYNDNDENNKNNGEENSTQSDIKRKEILEQYYDKNKDLSDENVGLEYIGLVFADVILLSIMAVLGFEIFVSLNLNGYDNNWLLAIILWVIDVFVLALFLKTVSQTIKCLKKM
jgi:hypothetical protein